MADEDDEKMNAPVAGPGAPFDADDYPKPEAAPPQWPRYYLTCEVLHQMGEAVPRSWQDLDLDLTRAFVHAYNNYVQKFTFTASVNIATGSAKPTKVPMNVQDFYSIWLEQMKEQYRSLYPRSVV